MTEILKENYADDRREKLGGFIVKQVLGVLLRFFLCINFTVRLRKGLTI